MNYCISGRHGFIGTAFTEYLINKGHNAWDIGRGLSIEELVQYFKETNPDYIIHTAAYGNQYDSQKDFIEMVNTNIIGTYNLLEAAKTTNCKKFYNFTSSSVFLKKQTYYSITKNCGEQISKIYDNVVNIRPYSAYGPEEPKHRFIPTIINCLNSGKEMTLDESATHSWIFIDDLVKAVFAGETELGGGVKTSNIEIVRILEDISGKKLNYIPGKLRSYDTDDWTPPEGVCYTSLHDGLKQTYESITRKNN
jgi:nucleoside-diphosphate-sugar epimerase